MNMRKEHLPMGFEFDPYMGDGVGALRLSSSGMKIVDEVDEERARVVAWSLVSPALEVQRDVLLGAVRELAEAYPESSVALRVVERVVREGLC